tara:strand:- start:35418 stop:35774 length:357 start_codon:yes stop_codon:yes gene_type:complete
MSNKYSSVKSEADGVFFDSKKERDRYLQLKLLERAGEITDLTLQPKFWIKIGERPVLIRSAGYPNGRRASYKADFSYYDKRAQKTIVEDVKSAGTRTEAYALRRAIVETQYQIEVREV